MYGYIKSQKSCLLSIPQRKMAYLKFPNNIDSTEALILAYMYINCTSACLENQAYDSKHKTVLGKTTL